MLDLIRDIILATDLAHHLRIFKDLQKMADGMLQQGALRHPTDFLRVSDTKEIANKEQHNKYIYIYIHQYNIIYTNIELVFCGLDG